MTDKHPKKIVAAIRVDSGLKIGTGHFVRCLTLAESLRSKGLTVTFICREHPGSSHQVARDRGFTVHTLPPRVDSIAYKASLMHGDFLGVAQAEDCKESLAVMGQADIVIIDHYGIDEDWEKEVQSDGSRLLVVIDDLADRRHACDILIDQNYYEGMENRYTAKVERHTRTLLGPSFAMIRPQFAACHRQLGLQTRSDAALPLKIVVSFGGTDSHGHGLKVVRAILNSPLRDKTISRLMGRYLSSEHQAEIVRFQQLHPDRFDFVGYTDRPWDCMASSDLYLGAGGSTTWERCALGLPAIVYAISKNQVQMSREFSDAGYQVYLGLIDVFAPELLLRAVDDLILKPEMRLQMGLRSRALVDGNGVERVIDTILNHPKVRGLTS